MGSTGIKTVELQRSGPCIVLSPSGDARFEGFGWVSKISIFSSGERASLAVLGLAEYVCKIIFHILFKM
ncbi:unnamed protein product [Peniophora sp. CBMAI 1063]|nr:unnamed protein product [Peniophora sp. CBMAI 1063]